MRWRGAARSALWLVVATLCAAPVPAFFSHPIPVSITIVLVSVAVLTVWIPTDALLILAALAPMAGAVHALSGAPYDSYALLEIFVLAVLSGAALRAAVKSAPLPGTPFDLAALSFICLALASCAALLPTALLRAGASDWRGALFDLFFRDYFLNPAAFVAVERTAVLVEGTALGALVAHVIRGSQQALRLSAMIVAGGAAAAALNLYRLLEVSLRRPPFFESLVDSLQSLRFNTQYGDLNAAGSYFAMVTILAGCHAGFRTRAGWMHAAALPLLGCALWVSGSRVALAAALLCTMMALALRYRGGALRRLGSRTNLVVAAGVLFVAFGLLIVLLSTARHGSVQFSVSTRLELLKTSARMLTDRPILGVGVSQYYALFPRYVSPELARAFADAVGHPVPRENAHNQFAQVLAELGVAGLVSFTLVLALAIGRGEQRELWRLAVIAAIAGFLLTSLAGHPLLTPVVAFSFWIVAGLAAAGSPHVTPRAHRILAWAVGAAALLLIASLPWRWNLERREADLVGVSLGLSAWQRDADGTRFQSMEGRATVFASRESPLVRIPLRSPDEADRRVQIVLDGRMAAEVLVVPNRWVQVRLPMPRGRDTPAYRRFDLIVKPSSVAGEMQRATLLVGRVIEFEP